MGFDGYYQRICGNGHNYVADALSEMFSDPTACHLCDSDTIVEENLVDTTNGCIFDDTPCRCGRKTVITLENGKQTLGAPEAHGTLNFPKRRTAKYMMVARSLPTHPKIVA